MKWPKVSCMLQSWQASQALSLQVIWYRRKRDQEWPLNICFFHTSK